MITVAAASVTGMDFMVSCGYEYLDGHY
uniref:Uncharacterized protein n=1 Tax=Lotus japonicus TaxID=34305 RepID=I3SGK4_LOTJA|nr:unknown [Lotus japonicus]